MKRAFAALLWLLIGIEPTLAQTPYFQGKTIRIVTGYPAGDVNDMWPRLSTQHMGKYIPGNPIFIVQNVPGEVMSQPPAVIERMKKVLGQ